ncbi:Asp-tRNA(Asn)/Glu-tRNA(Gln) amidotransferase subunit GatC [Campylobacter estrildidarum]|uniref:Aspartyl/glutamyl-tRNA(Asn/Gln) amidotransferase subunit C n=1 Tax=Campylobacter estrildidarum TaxID=2510189 RepID=A0A4V6DWD0_9BACT|nr:Asp-tRNA(Asn)/Glu-tRNA(Gln) amidotransferase subunit GatC [Campylobacter estrildidarum]TKX31332.1 Asp-tRNA(Asn)/Glu-tRNA(Gln) amidotransferase GatCAB subunit C [Campylobacter estrildidarum]
MQIDEKLLSKLEKLGTLKIAEEKRDEMIKELSEIVNFVDKLNELDLNSSQITVNTIEGGTPFREDKVNMSNIAHEILNHSPKSSEQFFIVPKIIE